MKARFEIDVWLDGDGRPSHQNGVKTTVRDLPMNLAKAAMEEAIVALVAEYDSMIKAHFDPKVRVRDRRATEGFLQAR